MCTRAVADAALGGERYEGACVALEAIRIEGETVMKGSEGLIEEESPLVLGHLLQTPLKRLKDMWAATERGPDWMGRVEQARMWPLVTPLYSGIEQGLKVLAAKELGTPVRTATGKGGRLRACRHDLGCVWKEVGTAEKDLIEEHWRQFVSLHDYIPLTSAQAFVEHLSGPEGTGYEEWRYCLIESSRVRETSIEAMMQVWESIIAACATTRNLSAIPQEFCPRRNDESGSYEKHS